MNKLLGIVAAIAFAAMPPNATQDGAALSTKPRLSAKQAPAANLGDTAFTVQRMCSARKVPVTINEQVATKPGHGTIQAAVSLDQCPSCGAKQVKELKQTQYIHT